MPVKMLVAQVVVDDIPMIVKQNEIANAIYSMIGTPKVGMTIDVEIKFIEIAKDEFDALAEAF